jgi:predicted tellurium resistance membrane protein TerC
MLELFSTTDAWISLLTLTLLEIVLGIDNVIFISIVTSVLPRSQQPKARQLGVLIALGIRIGLLLCISWIIGLVDPVFSIFDNDLSWRDLILLAGGLFLLGKSTMEINHKLEGETHQEKSDKKVSFGSVVMQVIILDIVFSFDSIITAVGLAQHVEIMIAAVVISMLIMMAAAQGISRFIEKHPSIKMLALSFLMMIGMMLVAEAFEVHVPKGYAYFAMAFSLLVELLNIRVRKKSRPVVLRDTPKSAELED